LLNKAAVAAAAVAITFASLPKWPKKGVKTGPFSRPAAARWRGQGVVARLFAEKRRLVYRPLYGNGLRFSATNLWAAAAGGGDVDGSRPAELEDNVATGPRRRLERRARLVFQGRAVGAWK
jgi:hypothetical protein